MEGGEKIDGHGFFEEIGGHGLDRADIDDAGVVDQNVQAAEAGEGFIDHAHALGFLRQVAGDEEKVFRAQMGVLLEQAFLCALKFLYFSRRQHEVDGALGEAGGDGQAQSAGAAGNQDYGTCGRGRGKQGTRPLDQGGGGAEGGGDDGEVGGKATRHTVEMHGWEQAADIHPTKGGGEPGRGGTIVSMGTKRKSKGAYMISSVAEMYDIHPQTLRLYEREGLLRPSRSDGNTRLYTDEDLERLEFILNLARDLGVNIAGIAIVLQMRERMEEMNRQMQGFVEYVRTEMLSRMQQAQSTPGAGLVATRRPMVVPPRDRDGKSSVRRKG